MPTRASDIASLGKMKVWCLLRDQLAHAQPVEEALDGAAEFIQDATWEPEALLAARPDIVLCVND